MMKETTTELKNEGVSNYRFIFGVALMLEEGRRNKGGETKCAEEVKYKERMIRLVMSLY